MNIKTFKILSLLMLYPTVSLKELVDESIVYIKDENLISEQCVVGLENLTKYIKKMDLLTLQEQYVNLFDRVPANSLHLFEHVHGVSNERGEAMFSLIQRYEEIGLFLNSNELPDYLPVFLEYLSLLSIKEASELLSEPITIIAILAERLKKRSSYYAALFDALVSISKVKPDQKQVEVAIARESGNNVVSKELDEKWVEKPAFGTVPIDRGAYGV